MSSAPTINRNPVVSAPGRSPGALSATSSAAGGSLGMVNIDPVRLFLRYWPVLVISAVIGIAIGVAAHLVLARLMPRYSAAVVFVAEPPVYDPTKVQPAAMGTNEFERFIGTQVAQMTSDSVLETAVQDPLVKATDWAKPFIKNGQIEVKDAAYQLSRDVSAGPIPMSELMRLGMTYSKPEDTATIANAVARAYLNDLQKFTRSNTSDRRDVMSKRLTQIDDELRRLRSSLQQLIDESQLPSITEGQTQEDLQMQQINESLVELVKSRTAINALLEKSEKEMGKAQAVIYPPSVEAEAEKNQVLNELTSQISQLKIELRSMRERGFGEDHPTVAQLKDRLRAAEIEKETKRQDILKQVFNAQMDDYRSQIQAFDEQEKKLLTDLESVNKRREDLRNVTLKKNQIDEEIKRLIEEQTIAKAAVKDLETVITGSAYDRVKIVYNAKTPTEKSFPKLTFMVPLGFFGCIGLVAGLIVLRELFDQRVRGPADLALIPRMSILGVVPDAAEDPARIRRVETCFKDYPTSVFSESFRQIRTLLVKRLGSTEAKSLLILAGMPGSGSTTMAANLAMSLAGVDERVLVIDANLRRPGIHKVFGLMEGPGLGDVLTGGATVQSAIQETNIPNLHVLSAGTPAARGLPERLGGQAFAALLSEVSTKYDRVIVDSSPAIVSGDGMALANRCDAVALVARAGGEKRGLVNRLRQTLSESRGEFIGVIINGVRHSAGGYFRKNIEATHRYQTAGV